MITSERIELEALAEKYRPAIVRELHLLTNTDALQLLVQLRAKALSSGGGRCYE